jgi:hypothetical protein
MATTQSKMTPTVIWTVAFMVLAVCFLLELWGTPRIPTQVEVEETLSADIALPRYSVTELIELDEDTSGLDCYACHEENKPVATLRNDAGDVIVSADHRDLVFSRLNCKACHPEETPYELDWDDDGNTIIPEEHAHLTIKHGPGGTNSDCMICHDSEDLTSLKTKTGERLKPEQSNQFCRDCHGPKYRDWEIGIHGRVNGYWDQTAGEQLKRDCTSCHDPHYPAFFTYAPARGPIPLHDSSHHAETENPTP